MFPQPPPFIPYGGFSPVRLEASLSEQPFRPRGRLATLACSPDDRHTSRCFYPLSRPSPYSRHRSIHRLRPQALGSAEVMLSSASWLLRPDPPVSQAPVDLTPRATPTGLCRLSACVTFPSLLWSPSAHAISSTPPADGFHLMVHPSILEAFVTGLPTRLTGSVPLELASCGSLSRGSDVRLFATACTVAWAAGQPPPETPLRRASPVTAELAPVEVSLVRRPLSLRGLTISYRGGTFTRWLAKDRRLHSPVRDERPGRLRPILLSPLRGFCLLPSEPTVETVGYSRSSLPGL